MNQDPNTPQVLIGLTGLTGTGKDTVAQMLHSSTSRTDDRRLARGRLDAVLNAASDGVLVLSALWLVAALIAVLERWGFFGGMQ